jgi:exodeoxyribonuclease V alpha subunit
MQLHARGSVKIATDGPAEPSPAMQLGYALDDFQMHHSRVWLADELVRAGIADSGGDIDALDRLAATLGVLVMSVAIQRGSTRVPVSDDAAFVRDTVISLIDRADELAIERDEVLTPLLRSRANLQPLLDRIAAFYRGEFLETLVSTTREPTYRPLVRRDGWLYTDQTWQRESSIVSRLRQRLSSTPDGRDASSDDARHIDSVLDAMPFDIDADERDAKRSQLSSLLGHRLGLLTGGPGTGKTTMILAVLRVLLRGDLEPADIALAAPTGKAAKRMRESIESQLSDLRKRGGGVLQPDDEALAQALPEAKTLHRLLRYSPRRRGFRRGPDAPIPAKVIIVDEASMLDLQVMDALLAAVAPEARLLLVGDADQLPAVGSGAVFRDLAQGAGEADALLPASVRLEVNHRSNPAIDELAKDINRGSFDIDANLGRCTVSSLEAVDPDAPVTFLERSDELEPDRFVEHWWSTPADIHSMWQRYTDTKAQEHGGQTAPSEEEVAAVQSALAKRRQDTVPHRSEELFRHTDDGGFEEDATHLLDAIFRFYDSNRLLCVTRAKAAGVNAVNRQMNRLYREKHDLSRRMRFHLGAPVMVTRNDYDHRLFNGDQGVVLKTLRPGEHANARAGGGAKKRVVFQTPDGYRAVRLSHIRDRLELSYALTVHKSQGSEFGRVALLLPEDPDNPLNTRELLYTGLTRARHGVVLYGAREVLSRAAESRLERYSGVHEKLVST